MKFIQQKYWCFSLSVLILLTSCNNQQNSIVENSKTTEQTAVKELTIIEIPAIEQDSIKTDSIVSKQVTHFETPSKQNVSNKNLKLNVNNPEPSMPTYVKMTEAKYWEWRKGKGYYNDSLGQRKVFLYELSSIPSLDSLTKEEKWQVHWNKYIEKIEKNNVIWDDSLRNIKNDPFFYKNTPINPLIE